MKYSLLLSFLFLHILDDKIAVLNICLEGLFLFNFLGLLYEELVELLDFNCHLDLEVLVILDGLGHRLLLLEALEQELLGFTSPFLQQTIIKFY